MVNIKYLVNCVKKAIFKSLTQYNSDDFAALKGNKDEALYCADKWEERGYTESLKVFMNPKDVSTVIIDNITNYKNLNVSDIFIEGN